MSWSKKSKTLFHNLLLIIVWFIFAFGLVYLLQNTELLQASILSMSDYKTIKKNNWDMAYKTQNNRIEVFCSDTLAKNHSPIKSILINVLYNDANIDWSKWGFQNSMHINPTNAWEVDVTISNITNIDCKESIIDIPFSGSYNEVIINTISLDNKLMRIGNLNKKTTHG